MNIKEKMNMNIKDTSKKITIRGIDFVWKFSMASLYDLMSKFNYESELDIIQKIKTGNIITMLEIFYVGIVWKDEEVDFRDFLIFVEVDDAITVIKDFLTKNLNDYLPKKKDLMK